MFGKIRSYLSPAYSAIQKVLTSKNNENRLLKDQIQKLSDPKLLESSLLETLSHVGRVFEEHLVGAMENWKLFGRTLAEDFQASGKLILTN